jgi:hypothetical protein
MIMKLRVRAGLAFTLFSIIALTVPSGAQTHPVGTGPKTLDLGLMYSTQVTNYVGAQKFWMQGGGVDAAYRVYKQFSGVVNFSVLHGQGSQTSDVSLTTATFTAGPRYTRRLGKQSKIFGQVLFGVTHGSDSVFPTSAGNISSTNAFALQAGAGYDLRWKERIAFRIPAVDYVRTTLPNGTTNVQNLLRISAGVVFTLPIR